MVFDPKAEPCSGCGREVDECICRPELEDNFDPLGELGDLDWDGCDPGGLTDEQEIEIPPTLG